MLDWKLFCIGVLMVVAPVIYCVENTEIIINSEYRNYFVLFGIPFFVGFLFIYVSFLPDIKESKE